MAKPGWKSLWVVVAIVAAGGCMYRSGTEYAGSGAVSAGGTASAPTLAGSAWAIEEIEGQPVLDKNATALRFDPDGRVSGNTGCNSVTGSATIAADKVTFSTLATTRRACAPEAMAQEQRLLKALEGVRNFSLDAAGTLRLLGQGGDPLVRLSRAP